MKSKYDLEDRLVKFAGDVIIFTNSIKNDYAGTHLKNQLIRSSTSPCLNYGEAQAAESKKDFIHKSKISVKELKETRAGLKILRQINYGKEDIRKSLLNECEELIAIFSTIIKNTKNNS